MFNANANANCKSRGDMTVSTKSVNEAIRDYLELERKYDDQKRKLATRNTATSTTTEATDFIAREKLLLPCKIRCISCGSPHGTVFSRANNEYAAVCGDNESPCR